VDGSLRQFSANLDHRLLRYCTSQNRLFRFSRYTHISSKTRSIAALFCDRVPLHVPYIPSNFQAFSSTRSEATAVCSNFACSQQVTTFAHISPISPPSALILRRRLSATHDTLRFHFQRNPSTPSFTSKVEVLFGQVDHLGKLRLYLLSLSSDSLAA